IVPVNGPGLIRKAPGMLMDRNQPLFLKWGYVPKLLPWLRKYLSHANADDTKRIAAALKEIVGDSYSEHLALAAGTKAERWLKPDDYVFVYRDRAHFEGDAFGWGIRQSHGYVFDELEGDAFRAYDPVFADEFGFGVRMADHGRITDPGAYVIDLADEAAAQGAAIVKADVEDVVRDGGQVTGVRASGEMIACDAVVVATGAWSKPLMKTLGIDVPLESERGYHMEFYDPSIQPRSPVMVASGKFVITPMEGRLRAAGIVEFGGLDAAPSRAPFALLKRNVEAALPGITYSRTEEWMGHRPAPSDSIPLIGEVPGITGAFAGFGHHHIGLTGGPKTGRLLAQLIGDKKANIDLTPYSPARFAR
ncbi:MAG: FAD-dependent oxidoreductase, partial [Pseudomonadota bacterium]